MAVLAEKEDPTGKSRIRERDESKALAGKSTLNRLELTAEVVPEKERYQKIVIDPEAVDRMLGTYFCRRTRRPRRRSCWIGMPRTTRCTG